MIRWLFLLVSDLERLIREKARVCEYVAVLAAEGNVKSYAQN